MRLLLPVLLLCSCTGLPDAEDPWAFSPKNDVGLPVIGFRWKQTIHDRSMDHQPQEFASPAVGGRDEDVIYAGSHGGRFFALSAWTGGPIWRVEVGSISSRPLVDRGRIFVGTDDGALVCLDTWNGSVKWRYETKGAILRQPVASGDLIVFATDADHVVAVERETGKWRWQYDRETPEEFTLRGHAGVVVADGKVFAGFADGYLVALTASRGEVVWLRSLAGKAEQFVDVDATPAVANGVVYAASSSGGLYAVDAADGAEKWRADVENVNAVGVDGRRLFVAAADSGLHALDLAGHILWRQGLYRAGDPGAPTVFGDYVIVNTSQDGLFVVEKQSGELLQSFNPGPGFSSEPTIMRDGKLYAMSNGGIIYALQLREF